MGKHAQSRSRYTAWSHSRLFPARESGGGCRTEVGGSLCNRLPVWHAVFLCQLHLVSRQRPGKLKELLRKFDHGAIYLHIAGTYTPFTLLVMSTQAVGDGEFSLLSGCRLSSVLY